MSGRPHTVWSTLGRFDRIRVDSPAARMMAVSLRMATMLGGGPPPQEGSQRRVEVPERLARRRLDGESGQWRRTRRRSNRGDVAQAAVRDVRRRFFRVHELFSQGNGSTRCASGPHCRQLRIDEHLGAGAGSPITRLLAEMRQKALNSVGKRRRKFE
jgi:hypothetical protein